MKRFLIATLAWVGILGVGEADVRFQQASPAIRYYIDSDDEPALVPLDLDLNGSPEIIVDRRAATFRISRPMRVVASQFIVPLPSGLRLGLGLDLPLRMGWGPARPNPMSGEEFDGEIQLFVWTEFAGFIGYFGNGVSGYAGFEWAHPDGLHYGWIRIEGDAFGNTGKITGWAWETEAGKAITIPEDKGRPWAISGIIKDASGVRLSWSGLMNDVVQVQYSETMKPGSWVVIGTVKTRTVLLVGPAQGLFRDSDLERAAKPTGYYRLTQLDPPP